MYTTNDNIRKSCKHLDTELQATRRAVAAFKAMFTKHKGDQVKEGEMGGA